MTNEHQSLNWPKVHALIPAAGLSVRFGGTTLKQYASILGEPVMTLSIAAVKDHPAIYAVTVILARDDGIYNELLAPDLPDVDTAIGGKSRAESVHNGLQHILKTDPDAEWVLIHDAARPCLSRQSLTDLLNAVFHNRNCKPNEAGAILAIQLADTLKKATEQPIELAQFRQQGTVNREHEDPPQSTVIQSTVSREGLWLAQTPQLFPIRLLAQLVSVSLRSGRPDHALHTDEASVMEAAGYYPRLVPGCPSNIKITGTKDLELAEAILQRRRNINRNVILEPPALSRS
jgi:2-C-methyl-D-erythritol 4-phosphate cytidylyltransferase